MFELIIEPIFYAICGVIEKMKKGKAVNIDKVSIWIASVFFGIYLISETLFSSSPFTIKKIFIISAVSFGLWIFVYTVFYLCKKYYKKKKNS
jgi:hypothetical protein